MRVRCERLQSPTTGEPLQRSPLLTIGREYQVLSVIAEPGHRILLQLIDDQGDSPSIWDARLFSTTSTRIPQLWGVRIDANGVLTLAPTTWLRDGFWDAYFDGDARAVAEFQSALSTLQAEVD
jgi:hypothetical protein